MREPAMRVEAVGESSGASRYGDRRARTVSAAEPATASTTPQSEHEGADTHHTSTRIPHRYRYRSPGSSAERRLTGVRDSPEEACDALQ